MYYAKYQLLWNDKMQNAKLFMGMFNSIQNAKFFMEWIRVFLAFRFFFLPLEGKIQNEEWIVFAKNFT
jgi:hypothetical protein